MNFRYKYKEMFARENFCNKIIAFYLEAILNTSVAQAAVYKKKNPNLVGEITRTYLEITSIR